MRVMDLLNQKNSEVWFIDPEKTVYSALEMMEKTNVGALLVMRDNRLVGIISERDYTRKVILLGRYSKDVLIREIMTTDILYVKPDSKVNDCMVLMTEQRVRHLPVMDGDTVVGVVSIGDVVKNIMEEQEHTISDYEQYIRGSY